AQILALLERLQRELSMAIVIITHDLGVVAEMADDISVMYAGRIVEAASAKLLFSGPEHPYTWGLLRSIPRLVTDRDEKLIPIPRGIIFQRRIGAVQAVDDVSFEVQRGETLGIVGESGCGKSTTARLVVRLLDATDGEVRFEGRDITHVKGAALKAIRREMQMIFQDPYSSLNPRKTIGSIIGEPFAIHGMHKDKAERKQVVQTLMETVGLNPAHYNRYPHEFSGGQ